MGAPDPCHKQFNAVFVLGQYQIVLCALGLHVVELPNPISSIGAEAAFSATHAEVSAAVQAVQLSVAQQVSVLEQSLQDNMSGAIAGAQEANDRAIERDVMQVSAKSPERGDHAVTAQSAKERERIDNMYGRIR